MDSLLRRFLDTGFTSAQALTLREIRQSYISGEELDRRVLIFAGDTCYAYYGQGIEA